MLLYEGRRSAEDAVTKESMASRWLSPLQSLLHLGSASIEGYGFSSGHVWM